MFYAFHFLLSVVYITQIEKENSWPFTQYTAQGINIMRNCALELSKSLNDVD